MDYKIVTLRPATPDDGETLLSWRNDPETRKASHNSNVVSQAVHKLWLECTLESATRQLFIAEENGVPVGSVRADFANGCYELSWTVAPGARGRGVAKQMIGLLTQQITGPIRAEVKTGNLASVRVAEAAGMKLEKEIDGVLHFGRAEVK